MLLLLFMIEIKDNANRTHQRYAIYHIFCAINCSIAHTAQCQQMAPIPILKSLLLNDHRHSDSQIFRNNS